MRATLDIDIFIRATPENAQRTRRALTVFGYDLHEVTDEELLTKKVSIRQYLVEADLHPFVGGVTFDEVWARRAATGSARRRPPLPASTTSSA